MSQNHDITIAEVAQVAGVSVSTVSRILNNRPDVAEATRQRVQQVIEDLGFRPHVQAQRLAAGKSRSIALLNPLQVKVMTYLEMGFFVGAANAAAEENFFFSLATRPVTEDYLLSLYRSAQVDGVILMEVYMNDWRVELLRQHNYPFVMIGHCANNAGLHFIDFDFENAIVTAFDHLVELGHQHIAFMAFPTQLQQAGFGPAVRTQTGYRKALQKHGLEAVYVELDRAVPDISEATVQLLDAHPELTGLVTVQIEETVGVVRALHQLGKKIPDDISVVAIASEKTAQLVTPPLTATNFPTYDMGYKASKMLISLLNNEPLEISQVLLPPDLIGRQSTGPAPNPVQDDHPFLALSVTNSGAGRSGEE